MPSGVGSADGVAGFAPQPVDADHAGVAGAENVVRAGHAARWYNAWLAEQEAGICAFYVLVAEDGSVLGRFNLYDFEDGTARLGYRVAQHVAGRGVATATVMELCRLAAARHGLRTLRAATARENAASQKVLTKAGFVPVGPADLGGKPGTWYQRNLVVQP